MNKLFESVDRSFVFNFSKHFLYSFTILIFGDTNNELLDDGESTLYPPIMTISVYPQHAKHWHRYHTQLAVWINKRLRDFVEGQQTPKKIALHQQLYSGLARHQTRWLVLPGFTFHPKDTSEQHFTPPPFLTHTQMNSRNWNSFLMRP